MCVLLRSPADFCFVHVAYRYFTVLFGHLKKLSDRWSHFGELVLPRTEKYHVFYVMWSAFPIGLYREHRSIGIEWISAVIDRRPIGASLIISIIIWAEIGIYQSEVVSGSIPIPCSQLVEVSLLYLIAPVGISTVLSGMLVTLDTNVRYDQPHAPQHHGCQLLGEFLSAFRVSVLYSIVLYQNDIIHIWIVFSDP